MPIQSSGEINFSDIANNQNSASLEDLQLKSLSETFASGSIVDGSGAQTTARLNLDNAPYAISEFYDANFSSDEFSNIVLTTTGGDSDFNVVDGENLVVSFDTTQAGTHTVQLVDSSDNVDASDTGTPNLADVVVVTFSSLALTDDTYTPRIRLGFLTQDATDINYHDAITMGAITDPSDTTVANASATTNIEHQVSITNDNAFNDINWTFAKSSGDGSAPANITNSSDRSPLVTYTGPGVFTVSCRVDGLPSQARNSANATNNGVSHRIDYTKAVSIGDPGSLNEGQTINTAVTHQGFSSGVDVDLIRASDNAVLLSNDHTTDSRVTKVTNQNQTFTAPAQTTSTLSVKVKAFDGSDSDTSAAFNIYPLIDDEFANGDISAPSAVEVNSNATLSVSGVTDNLVGFAWRLVSGAGGMTAQAGYSNSGGDTDGTSSDSTSLISTSDVTNIVRFDTAQQGKTIGLKLYGRINQESTERTATIDVELADAISINSISDTNSPNAITVSGNHSGFQNGVTAGFVLSSNTTSFVQSTEETTNPDSRFTQRSFSENFTPADQTTTQTLQGRVVADVDGDSANTSTFSYFPELKTSRNVVNPTSKTIYSTTNNTNTTDYPTSFVFGSPTTRTDNVTQGTYTEQADSSNAISLSGDLTPSSQTTTQPTVSAGGNVGDATVRYTVDGNSSQQSATDCSISVDYFPVIHSVGTPTVAGNGTTSNQVSISYNWQGFAVSSARYELFDDEDLETQLGNDVNEASPNAGGAQSSNSSGTINFTSLAATFGHSTAGSFKIKVTLYTGDTQNGFERSAFSGAFSAITATSFSLIGVGSFGGYSTLLLAAEQASSTTATKYRFGSISDGDVIYNTSATDIVFNGGSDFFNFNGEVFSINSSGVVANLRSDTPSTPSINGTAVSTATDDITIRITGNTQVTREFTVNAQPDSGGAALEGTVAADLQAVAITQDISLKDDVGLSLSAGETYAVKVRADNNHQDGTFTATTDFDTDSARSITIDDGSSATDDHVNANTVHLSDKFTFTVEAQANDQLQVTLSASGNNLTRVDVDMGHLPFTAGAGTVFNSSGVAQSGVVVSSDVSTSTAVSLTETGLNAGTNTVQFQIRSQGDGGILPESTQTMNLTVSAKLLDSGGSTVVSSANFHTYTVRQVGI